MAVHKAGDVCAGCEDKLRGAHPTIAAWYRRTVKPAFPDCHISWAWRGEFDQNQAVKDGASNAPWPTSKHNFMKDGKPCSLALDLFRLSPEGRAEFPVGYYYQIAELSTEKKAPIKWGVRVKGKADLPHFELTGKP